MVMLREAYQDLRRMTEDVGPARTKDFLDNAFRKGHIKTSDFSIREAFEGLVPEGDKVLRAMERRKQSTGGYTLKEASGAVDTSAFSNITGQFLFTMTREKFELPEFLWPKLCNQQQTVFLDGERIPGIGGIGDKSEDIMEGDEYPMVGVNEEYVDRGKARKYGHIVPVSKEIIIADRTGLLMQFCSAGATWLGLNCEKRVLALATGVVNNYKRNGTATNTFLTSGAYVNTVSTNALYDWTNVQTARLAQRALTDPNTGEYINPGNCDVLIPPALEGTAYRVKTATQVEHVDNTAAATTIRTFSGNPVSLAGVLNNVYLSQYVKAATSSDSTWFGGDWKKAITRFYVWDITTEQAPNNSEAEFTRDIQLRFKTSMMDQIQMMEPRYLFKCTA